MASPTGRRDFLSTESGEKRHPIQVVARRTGMTADRLRAWEKRYGVVEPARSDGGRRLYSDDDIELLRLLHRAVLGGRRISRVAELGVAELRELVKEDEEEEAKRPADLAGEGWEADPQVYLKAALAAVGELESDELDSVLRRAAVNLSAQALLEAVAAPLLKEIGDRWCSGDLSPGHEHLASQVVRRVVGEMMEDSTPSGDAPLIVVGTPSGHLHEFGALFVAATAASQGWKVAYLGPDLPAEDLARVVREKDAAVAALSLVYPLGDSGVEEELRRLRQRLPQRVVLMAGGGATESYRNVLREVQARIPSGLAGLRQELAALN